MELFLVLLIVFKIMSFPENLATKQSQVSVVTN